MKEASFKGVHSVGPDESIVIEITSVVASKSWGRLTGREVSGVMEMFSVFTWAVVTHVVYGNFKICTFYCIQTIPKFFFKAQLLRKEPVEEGKGRVLKSMEVISQVGSCGR